ARTERGLARHGIFSLLDVHQDLYNERFEGEGFPDWAVVGDAATIPAEPKQGFPANYLGMEALNRAFDNFWMNEPDAAERPLRGSFAAMWKQIAKRFKGRGHVLGYNLLNEPWPGSQYPSCTSNAGCPGFDTQFLEPFSERVIAAIRKVDRRSLVWYAPLLLFDFGADTSHGDTGDPNAGFAFNMYCLGEVFPDQVGTIGDGSCETGYDLTLDNAEEQSAETGDALLLTEFAATDDLATVERVAELADQRMIGWQQWHYCDCRDPTTTGTGLQSLVSNPHKPPRGENLNRGKLLVSSRPYPRATSGTPRSYSFVRAKRRFELRYSTTAPDGKRRARRLPTEVFLPPVHYGDGYRVNVKGAEVVSPHGARVLKLKRHRAAKRVSVVVRPPRAR
ncbi:MAG: cellulase family glycosylhydrolase, partial [Solirubrobacterales bacterium]|nr:cellulase family glycosylhydrolase [Solirubrobacterales bacterium]